MCPIGTLCYNNAYIHRQLFVYNFQFIFSPWFKSGTIRDNILLGHTDSQQGFGHRTKLYEKVIRECGLMEDLQRLPDGDLTWVQKNGGNLSGGQRQRVSLARAVFKNAGTYFLDDPMSAIGEFFFIISDACGTNEMIFLCYSPRSLSEKPYF